jgi:CHAD domain-containing protein
MLKLLDSRRYEEFLEGFAGFLQRGPTRRVGAQPPVLAAAPELIARRYRKARRLARAITEASPPEAYHALRIRLKRLRYAVEFLAPLYGRPARALIRRVVALQDLLGRHQDACTAVAHLRELALAPRRKLPPATLFVMGQIAGHTLREAEALRRRFPKAYRKLEGRPWRALHAAMEDKRPADEGTRRETPDGSLHHPTCDRGGARSSAVAGRRPAPAHPGGTEALP